MKNIIDLTDSYVKNVLKNGDTDNYEKSYPELFDHYYKYWADRSTKLTDISEETISLQRDLILNNLEEIESKFFENGIFIRDIDLVLFVGNNTSNGHAMIMNNKVITWIPVETYTSEKRVKSFVPHELLHSIHYNIKWEFYFKDSLSKNNILRQLITEGLATYYTSKMMDISVNDSIWGGYLSPSEIIEWKKSIISSEKEIIQFILVNCNSSIENCGLFTLFDKTNIMNFRPGYYIGYKLIEQLVLENEYSFLDIIMLNSNVFRNKVIDKLEDWWSIC